MNLNLFNFGFLLLPSIEWHSFDGRVEGQAIIRNPAGMEKANLDLDLRAGSRQKVTRKKIDHPAMALFLVEKRITDGLGEKAA